MPAPPDKVQLIKRESESKGGDPNDAHPFFLEVELDPNEDAPSVHGVFLQPPRPSTVTDKDVYIVRDSSGNMLFRDTIAASGAEVSLDDLLGGSGSGITESQHSLLRQLIHFINDGPAEGFVSGTYKEILPPGDVFPTSVVWWESSDKLKKIVEKLITRSGGSATNIKPTPVVWKMYAVDGTTTLAEVSDAITYNGQFESTRTRTITVY